MISFMISVVPPKIDWTWLSRQGSQSCRRAAVWCSRRRGPDDYAEPAAADIPAVDADVDSGELIAAQLPQVLVMHDPSHGSQMGSCSHEPPRGNQYLGRGQDAHHDSMGTCRAR